MIEMLYKKKIIRDFLSLFTENYWKQLISSILEYGIINFKKHHSIASLTPEDIFNIVDVLKKDENLMDKTKSNLSVLNKIKKGDNIIPRSRSRSNSSTKDNKILKSNNLLKNVNSNLQKVKISSNVNSYSTEKNINKFNHSESKTNSLKNKIQMTPNKDDNKYNTNYDNKKVSINSRSLLSRSKSINKNPIKNEISNKKDFITSNINNIKNIKHKYSNANDSDNERSQLKSQRLDTSLMNKKTNEPEIHTEKKKKKPSEILEQIQLKKLKQKKKNVITNNTQQGSSVEKEISNDNLTDEDLNKIKKPTISNKFTNVQSKLKNVFANDKKIYNLMKNQNSSGNLNNNIPHIEKEKESEINTKINENQIYSKEKFIGDGYSNNNYSSKTMNSAKTSILSLEERLNGLTQKISQVEKSSYKYNDFIDGDDDISESTNIPVKSYINNSNNINTNKSDNFSFTNSYNNYPKKSSYNDVNNSVHNVQDEDYIAEDQIDLNKYNYLFNNINKNENYNDMDNDGYEIGNHNYDDLEEE